MIPGQTCGNCAAFAAMARECRRKSPTAVPIQNDKNQVQSVGFFPETTHDRWCLEYVPDFNLPKGTRLPDAPMVQP